MRHITVRTHAQLLARGTILIAVYSILIAACTTLVAGCGGHNQASPPNDQQQIAPPTTPMQLNAPRTDAAPPDNEQPHRDGPRAGAPQQNQPAPAPGEPKNDELATAERQIIRNASLSLQVRSLDSAEAHLSGVAVANGGFVASSNRVQTPGTSRSGSLELRVPSARFEATLAAVRAIGEVTSESVSTNDVTQQYIDLNARLNTQKELEARLLRLLQEKSGKLEEIIQVEEKLASVRSGIEQIQGELRVLGSQVSMSTLTVSVYEPGAVGSSSETFGGRMARAVDEGVSGLVGVLGTLITIVLALLPIIAIALVLYYLLLRPLFRRLSARSASAMKKREAELKGNAAEKNGGAG